MFDVDPKNALAVTARVVSTFISLRYAGRHELVTLRHLAPLAVLGAVVAHIPHSLLRLRQNTQDGSSTPFSPSLSILLGFGKGLRLTLFFWTLVKLPPGPAMALYALSSPISGVVLSLRQPSTTTVSLRTWITAILLLLTSARVIPMNPHTFFFASLSLLLSIGISATNSHLPASTIQNPYHNLILNLSALVPAIGLAAFLSDSVFGDNINHIYKLKAHKFLNLFAFAVTTFASHYIVTAPRSSAVVGSMKTLGVTVALIVSAFFPLIGSRVTLYDEALLGAVAVLSLGEALTSNTETSSGDYVATSVEDIELSPSNPPPKPLSRLQQLSNEPSASTQRTLKIIAITLISYILIIQVNIIPILPHDGRWDVRSDYKFRIAYFMVDPTGTTPAPPPLWTSPQRTFYKSSHIQSLREAPLSFYTPPQLEVVISYFDEPLDGISTIISRAYAEVPHWTKTSTLYHKGMRVDSDQDDGGEIVSSEEVDRRMGMFMKADELKGMLDVGIATKNVGRDGGTHLKHIIDNYDRLADFTIFLQGHIPWMWEYDERLKLLNERTGFMAFGHYMTVKNNTDMWGNGYFSHISDIWELFQPNTPYPRTTRHLGSYHGEFGVSRARIRRTPRAVYHKIYRILTADKDDPIYKEEGSWGYKGVADGPSNPFFGHALERSWALMFNCYDPIMEWSCWFDWEATAACACWDEPTGLGYSMATGGPF